MPAFAAAALVAVIASMVMLRIPEPTSSRVPQIVTAPTVIAPQQTAATPQPAEQAIAAPRAPASILVTPKVRRPAPATASVGGGSIFGPPSQRVTAASVGPEPLPAAAAPVDPMPMPDALEPIAPIVIEPIVITPITVTPLIVRTPDRR